MVALSDAFLAPYREQQALTPLGAFTFYRTYSRWLPEEQRRERWWETVRRVVEFGATLGPYEPGEAEQLYDNIFWCRQFPAGRSLWLGGSEAGKAFPLGQFNCSARVMDAYPQAFAECMYALLVGTGIGVRILPRDVAQYPPIHAMTVIHEYHQQPPEQRLEDTHVIGHNGTLFIDIGDSKEGK